MKNEKKPRTIMTSVNVNADLYDLTKKLNLTFKEAMEFGIRFMVADIDGFDYPDCNLQEKLQKIVKHRNALIMEVDALRQQVEGVNDIEEQETKREINNIFDAKPLEEKNE